MITYLILAVIALFSLVGFARNSCIERCIFSIYHIRRQKQYYRFVSSLLIHGDWSHLLFNAISLYSFGEALEASLGAKLYLLLFFVSSFGGDLLTLLYRWRQESYSSLGASGAISGVVFASILLSPHSSMIIFPLPIPIPGWVFAILFLAISMFGLQNNSGNISHEAHLGGALAGMVTILLFEPSLFANRLWLISILGVFFLTFTLWSLKRNRRKN